MYFALSTTATFSKLSHGVILYIIPALIPSVVQRTFPQSRHTHGAPPPSLSASPHSSSSSASAPWYSSFSSIPPLYTKSADGCRQYQVRLPKQTNSISLLPDFPVCHPKHAYVSCVQFYDHVIWRLYIKLISFSNLTIMTRSHTNLIWAKVQCNKLNPLKQCYRLVELIFPFE